MTLPSYAADRRLLPADPDAARPTWIRQAAHRSHGSARHQKAAPATKSPRRTADLARRSRPAAVTIRNRSSGKRATYRLIGAVGPSNAGFADSAQINHSGVSPCCLREGVS